MEALIGSGTQNDVEEEVEVEDDEDDAADADGGGDAEMAPSSHGSGKKMQRLRRLHRTLFFARQLQVPDWMLVPPEDLAHSWMVLARPEGDRCLLLSDGGRVEVRKKNGYVQERYTDSRFPRGLTVLDAVCIEGPASPESVPSTSASNSMPDAASTADVAATSSSLDVEVCAGDDDEEEEMETETLDADMGGAGGYSGRGRGGKGKGSRKGKGKGRRSRPQGNRTYAICDVLVWGDVDMAGAEAECRLFWLESRFEEMLFSFTSYPRKR